MDRCCQTNANQSLVRPEFIGLPEPPMARISYKRYRFPPTVIQHAVWLYFRFTLSLRDVEEMLAHRGIDVSYETIRWCCQTNANQSLERPWPLAFGRPQ